MGIVQMLDCTLRDGAYVVDAKFGVPVIKGIIKKLQEARINIIECGWLKDQPYEQGSTFYHVPFDLEQFVLDKKKNIVYTAMIDWNRYNTDDLPDCNGKSLDAIRVVFPKEKYKEGIAVGNRIKKKGYQVYFQAANTLAYSDDELIELAAEINQVNPAAVSIVDTFGAMFGEDLEHIVAILNQHLNEGIALGFHAHNNQQMAFALEMRFVELLVSDTRNIIVDSCLCGMGRGAGNATTELIAGYLNRKQQGNYDMNVILDAIDMYMGDFISQYQWGYSTPYFIAGMYCAHVNNISYLLENHRTNSMDIKNIIESLSEKDRKQYDYALLEEKYLEYENKVVNDEQTLSVIRENCYKRKVLLLLPGKTILDYYDDIIGYIKENNPLVFGVNAVMTAYPCDYIFFSNKVRYEYAKDIYSDEFSEINKLVFSNIKTVPGEKEMVVNFNLLVKRGWKHFDNAGIMCLRFLNRVQAMNVAIAGFDGFENAHSENYADASLPFINPGVSWDDLNSEIKDMFQDFKKSTVKDMEISFITPSKFGDRELTND